MNASGFDASLAERTASLAAQRGGSVPIDELNAVVGALVRGIEGSAQGSALRVHGELVDLVDYIRRAKHDIATIKNDDIGSEKIPLATDELDAVVRATEEATSTILDVAESMLTISETVAPETGEQMVELATRIFEASNFQDITGQRIAKVVATLRFIEDRVNQIAGESASAAGATSTASPEEDGRLENGPQLPENANSQDDIDALFASL